jgi:hypothetical protein
MELTQAYRGKASKNSRNLAGMSLNGVEGETPSVETRELAQSYWSEVLPHTKKACLDPLGEEQRLGPTWIEHYNLDAPQSGRESREQL